MKVFVYGTLRHEYNGHMSNYLRENARLITNRATTRGEMYMLGYPGVIDGDDLIHGDVFEVQSDEVLTQLDAYEGHPNLFERQKRFINMPDGEQVEAWIYVYQGNPNPDRRIESGDYLAHIASR